MVRRASAPNALPRPRLILLLKERCSELRRAAWERPC